MIRGRNQFLGSFSLFYILFKFVLERSCRLNGNNYITFTAPCDGTIEMCYKPGGSLGQSIYLIVNGEQVGETIELEEGNDTFKYLG